MKHTMKHAIILGTVISLGLMSHAQADFIVTSWDLRTWAANTPVESRQSTVSLPFQTSDTVTSTFGTATATSTYDFMVSGGSAWFEFDFEHSRQSQETTTSSIAISGQGDGIRFDVTNEDLAYSFDGFYALTGDSSIIMHVFLEEYGTGILFRNTQISESTTNESFTLGGTGGDASNTLIGSPNGVLTAGKSYGLFYTYRMADFFDVPASSAVGELNFHATPISTIPEPSSIVLLGIGCVGLCGYGWRKRKAA